MAFTELMSVMVSVSSMFHKVLISGHTSYSELFLFLA